MPARQLLSCLLLAAAAPLAAMPADFVDVTEWVPDLVLDMRYTTPHNFVAAPVDAYHAPRCVLTRPAAEALAQVQAQLRRSGLSLKVYDCYRPQPAVDHFVRWAEDLAATETKREFYPTVVKRELFARGYIAARSGHSRGSTLDLTIVPSPTPAQPAYTPGEPLVPCDRPADERWPDNSLDMGTGFDCFHPQAHTLEADIGPQQRANRLLLKSLMERHGFVNYDREWWHYTLADEPYPDTYFSFPVE